MKLNINIPIAEANVGYARRDLTLSNTSARLLRDVAAGIAEETGGEPPDQRRTMEYICSQIEKARRFQPTPAPDINASAAAAVPAAPSPAAIAPAARRGRNRG
jgi:hypothetical protein